VQIVTVVASAVPTVAARLAIPRAPASTASLPHRAQRSRGDTIPTSSEWGAKRRLSRTAKTLGTAFTLHHSAFEATALLTVAKASECGEFAIRSGDLHQGTILSGYGRSQNRGSPVVGAMEDKRSDNELLIAARDDSRAFACFYRRHSDRVLRYFASRTDDPEVAADLMAETFASAFAGLRRYESRDAPAVAWLFTIARNLLADAYRRGQVRATARRRLGLEPLWLDDADIAKVEALRETPDVETLLGDLSVNERAAIRARILDERSYPDIAGELRCSESVIRKRVSRGLARLRPILEEQP
jgi:RNA polymerase sigma factor (sigma-70 family)